MTHATDELWRLLPFFYFFVPNNTLLTQKCHTIFSLISGAALLVGLVPYTGGGDSEAAEPRARAGMRG